MELFKKAFLAGLGALSLSRERIRAIVNELVEQGTLKEKEGTKLVEEMVKKAEVTRRGLEKNLRQKAKTTYTKMNVATQSQLKKMEEGIRELRRALEKTQAPPSAGKRPAKHSKSTPTAKKNK